MGDGRQATGREDTLRELLRWRRLPDGLRHLRRHGLRATLRRLFPALRSYRAWVAHCDTLSRDDVAAIRRQIAAMSDPPVISLLIEVPAGEAGLVAEAVAGLSGQLYPHWEVCLGAAPDSAEALSGVASGNPRVKLAVADGAMAGRINAALAVAGGELVAVLDSRDELAPHALYLLAIELAKQPHAVLIYSDEDMLGPRRRRRAPRFQSDWNPDLLFGCDMIGRLAAYRRGFVEQLGGLRPGFDGAEEYDLALRSSEHAAPDQLRHLPFVLYRRAAPATGAAAARRRALVEHFDRVDQRDVKILPGLTDQTHRIVWPLPRQPPVVSLIVPVGARLGLVRECLSGLLEQTDYRRLQLLPMVNAGTKPEVLPYLDEISADARVTVIDTRSDFNFSRICNMGVEHAQGEIVGLVNDDLKIIEPGWLREMVSHAVRSEIGVVGAKLYYPDDTIQHAGVIIAPRASGAGHWFRHARRDAGGYDNRLLVAQNLCAVTAACMLVRKSVYRELGGMDEANLAIAFNDVDFCLRARAKGYRVVWTPFAELYHMESASRGSDLVPEQIDRFRREVAFIAQRWSASIPSDPYYNPNLSLRGDQPDLAFPPTIVPPWRVSSAAPVSTNDRNRHEHQ
jgi:O-antigen biosynthesis protein